MSSRRLWTINRLAIAILILFAGGLARGQGVVLHLRNGDRIEGIIITENTNQVVLSNSWINNLTVPLAQIERREIVTNAPAFLTGTNKVYGTILNRGTILVATNGAPLPVNTNTFWRRWKGEAAIGTDMERGATDHQLYYGKVNTTYTQPYANDPKEAFKQTLTYDAAYGKTDGTLSDNRMGGSSKTAFDLSPKYYVFNLGSAYYDEIRKIDLHYEDGPGVGYHWCNFSNFAVNLELGANYQVEYRSDDTSTHSAYYRLGEDLMWKISKQATFTQKYEYYPRVGYATQYRMRFEANLSYALLWHLAWNLSVVDFYDTQPAAGVPNNDLQFRTSLGVKF